jgi:hypothetical protein
MCCFHGTKVIENETPCPTAILARRSSLHATHCGMSPHGTSTEPARRRAVGLVRPVAAASAVQ